ncbi:hypothetical protein IFM89_000792, partial [Coptis chinensis]
SIGTELTRDYRRKLYSSFGLLPPYGHEELAVCEDIDQVRAVMEKYPPYQSIFSKMSYGESQMLDKAFYEEEVKRECLAFEQQACVEPVLKVNLFVRQDRQSGENKNNPELHTFFYSFTDSQWITPFAFLGLWESSLESVPKLSRGAYKEVEINRMIPAVVYWH